MRNLIAIRQLARQRRWQQLVQMAEGRRVTESETVVALLSRHCSETAALLLASFRQRYRGAVAEALARCDTPEAVSALRNRALSERDTWTCAAILHALSRGGPAAQAALDELAHQDPGALAVSDPAYSRRRERIEIRDIPEPRYPPVPAGTKLPTDIPTDPQE